ncbi:MAG: DUF4186 domain-containing protein [Clostridia bacterium]|nr:DUF4186 domain-containing protein [Clostridia bacterium]
MTVEEALARLKKSPFRRKFHLGKSERDYVREKGIEKIREHAEEFIRARLAPATPKSDGRQTPMRGHPVFIAQHACACCCRGCLEKWYRVKRGTPLTETDQSRIVNLLIAWIEADMGEE